MLPMLILLAVVALASGPIALIVSLLALRKVNDLERRRWVLSDREDLRRRPPLAPVEPAKPVEGQHPPVAGPESGGAGQRPRPQPHVVERPAARSVTEMLAKESPEKDGSLHSSESLQLEQRIGTRWVLIAGVVTVIFAVGYFLKYAHDNQWIGPWGKIICAVIGGFVALIVGEVTRRRGYEIVAKGVTALGFAILYAAIFAAHRWYALIDSAPAYVLAVSVTVMAMLYAVVLDEIVAATLALVGGYITPVIISTGQNAPTLLFGYVLILSAGAMLCAYSRRWPALNVVAFLGTFALYTGWFERFYRPAMRAADTAEQLGVAVCWLTVFFLVYLVLPVLHGLIRRVKSEPSDVVLVLVNASLVFYYLATMLVVQHRKPLAACSLGIGMIHLAMAAISFARCREDSNLRHSLLAAGLAFVTLAVPLYLRAYAIVMVWAVEGVVLTVIGLRYRNTLIQIASGIVGALTIGKLLLELPLHAQPFRIFLNPDFGAWCFVAIAIVTCHALFRTDSRLEKASRNSLADLLYAAGLLVLLTAVTMEIWHHSDLNVKGKAAILFARYMMPVPSLFLLLCLMRPIGPSGRFSLSLAASVAAAGVLLFAFPFSAMHNQVFTIFLNLEFFWVIVFVAVVFLGSWLLRRAQRDTDESFLPPAFLPLMAVSFLWIMLTQEIWCYWRCLEARTPNWELLAHMCISIMWAAYAVVLMVIGFWRGVRLLRYMALAGFVLLLAKIFLIDTRTLESIYRIAGFLVTGLVLVGVSYLYQFLKKKGFFNKMLADEQAES